MSAEVANAPNDSHTDAGRGRRPTRKAALNASNAMRELASNHSGSNHDGEPSSKKSRGRPKNPNAKPKVVKKSTGAGRGRPKKNAATVVAEPEKTDEEPVEKATAEE